MAEQIRKARRRGHQARQAAPQLRRLDHRQELRQQPRPGHARHPLRPVGARTTSRCKLLLKGGGCENRTPSTPCRSNCAHLGRADRNLEGVRKCILHAVWQAQGKGCSPGAIGVCIGGDRASGLRARQGAAVPHARRREPGSGAGRARSGHHGRRSTRSASARWASAATTTLIGCKIGALNRLPASFFVSVAYDCWAFRRLGVVLDAGDRRDHAAGCTAIRRRRWCRWPTRPASSGPGREIVLTAPFDRGDDPRAEGGRRRAAQRPHVHRAATRCTPT